MSKSAKSTALTPYKDQYVSFSNEIARAKEKSSLLEARIELLAIYYLRKDFKIRVKTDSAGNHYNVKYVDISAKEIKNLMGRKDSDAYTDIKNAALALSSKIYVWESSETQQFSMDHIYDKVVYEGGVLSVGFNPDMEKHFLELSDRFTTLSLEIAFSLKKTGALQLYKLLKSEAYRLPAYKSGEKQEELPCIELAYSLPELRMNLGFVDLDQPKLKREASKKNPDFAKMDRAERSPKYRRFSDFEARILGPGIEELNSISDIYIAEVRKEASGRGGKITGVTFVLQWNAGYSRGVTVESGKMPTTEKEINSFCDTVMDLVPVKIKINDAKAIAEAANYDIDSVRRAVDALNANTSDVNNVVGWLVKAIKEGWTPVKKAAKNSFNNFKQNNYDYDEIEKNLIAN